jgi:hypothetical protein
MGEIRQMFEKKKNILFVQLASVKGGSEFNWSPKLTQDRMRQKQNFNKVQIFTCIKSVYPAWEPAVNKMNTSVVNKKHFRTDC